MNDDELKNLFAKSRRETHDTSRLQFGFETRLQARLRAEREAPWFGAAWKLCPYFAAITVAAGLWYGRELSKAPSLEQAALATDDFEMVEDLTGEEI